MFVLKRSISRDGDSEHEDVLIFDKTVEGVRNEYNKYATRLADEYQDRDSPPMMSEDEVTCSKSYSGGGCYAVFTYTIEPWEDRI